jgi:hypothetical protein
VILILTAAFLRVKPKESHARISFFDSTKGEHHLKQLNAWEQFRVMYSEWKDKKTINRDLKNQVKGLLFLLQKKNILVGETIYPV